MESTKFEEISQENVIITNNTRTTSLDMELRSQKMGDVEEILVTSSSDPNEQLLTDPASSNAISRK